MGWTLEDAFSWLSAGIADPVRAAQWRASSFSPECAADWEQAIRDVSGIAAGPVALGFDPREAAAARVAGVARPPELAQRTPGDLTRLPEDRSNSGFGPVPQASTARSSPGSIR